MLGDNIDVCDDNGDNNFRDLDRKQAMLLETRAREAAMPPNRQCWSSCHVPPGQQLAADDQLQQFLMRSIDFKKFCSTSTTRS